ncbi:hypothetical protein [Liquorilactobacillus vini]|uniref:Uncharacterized protein n=1 Tax=Liquorilactobacillus vini DSM 20605 TaxID=1133569 RepID=A0A0R2CLU6_9LACO|nr:hypothetical protein [Liquorilactobacillus vini]KRM89529.1 hypothetical protein FD21_GL001386 [Liquorilactobacillus vini DSM 20605]
MEATHLNNSDFEAQIIKQRLKLYFTPYIKARYEILVVNDIFAHSYNFFFNIYRPLKLPHSIPLRRITFYRLEFLENVVANIRTEYKFSFVFRNFGKQRWPSNFTLISKQ